MPNLKKHIFLSYCHDNQREAEHLRHDLESAGLRVWWDRDIKPGQDWKRSIREAIANSSIVLACFSKEAEAREASGLYPELRDAIETYRQRPPGDVFLIPVRFSQCQIPPLPIDGSRTLDNLQFIDLFPKRTRDQGIKKLLASVKRVESPSASAEQDETLSLEIGRLAPKVKVEISFDGSVDADRDHMLEILKRIIDETGEITIRDTRRG
jgi:hypothetical protein